MRKDIFVDTNVAKNFSNPMDENYKKFKKWLEEEGVLVVSNSLLAEYGRTNQNLSVLINTLLLDGRLEKIKNSQLKELIFPKRIERRLTCNHEDREHLKVVLLSDRKMAIIIDEKFRNDVNNYSKVDKIQPQAVARPEQINYST